MWTAAPVRMGESGGLLSTSPLASHLAELVLDCPPLCTVAAAGTPNTDMPVVPTREDPNETPTHPLGERAIGASSCGNRLQVGYGASGRAALVAVEHEQ